MEITLEIKDRKLSVWSVGPSTFMLHKSEHIEPGTKGLLTVLVNGKGTGEVVIVGDTMPANHGDLYYYRPVR